MFRCRWLLAASFVGSAIIGCAHSDSRPRESIPAVAPVIVQCDPGSRWDGKQCLSPCNDGESYVEGRGCVAHGIIATDPPDDSEGQHPFVGAGRRVRITDPGKLYSTINTIDCLTWPSEALKQRGGSTAWNEGDFYPSKGDIGTVLGESKHCHAGDVTVLILDVKGHIVPIGSEGVVDQ